MEATIENNKLIAEFIGFDKCIVRNMDGKQYDYNLPNNFTLIKEQETTIESQWCEILMEQDHCFVEDLLFHSSWDWLMPVVDKIGDIYHSVKMQKIEGEDQCKILCYIDGELDSSNVIECFGNTMIEATYTAVVEFIKWYNVHKK